MSEYWVANLICSILLGFFLLTVHALVYRWLFIRPVTELCSNQTFHQLILNEVHASSWCELSQYWSRRSYQLGWIGDCLCQASASATLANAEEIGRKQDQYLQPLILIGNLSTLFGLLGTVGAFLVSDDVNDVAFSTAFRTTAMGILVSMPPALYMALTHNARSRFDTQFDQFVEFINQFAKLEPPPQVVTKAVNPKVALPTSIASNDADSPPTSPAEAYQAVGSRSLDYKSTTTRDCRASTEAETFARRILEGGTT